MKFEPVLDNLIIQPIEEPKMAGAVVLPDTAVDKPCKAKVMMIYRKPPSPIARPANIPFKKFNKICFILG